MNRQQHLTQDEERLYHAAEILSAIAEPEALRVLRRLATGPVSSAAIAQREHLEPDEVDRYIEQLGHAGLVHAHAKRWYELTSLGRLAWQAARPLVC